MAGGNLAGAVVGPSRGHSTRLALAALFCILAAGSASARCERGEYTAVPPKNTRSDVLMLASSGKECVIRLSASRRIQVLDRRIATPPVNGKATIEGQTVFYRSFPGYVGPDSFIAEIAGRDVDGREGVAKVVVTVTVEE